MYLLLKNIVFIVAIYLKYGQKLFFFLKVYIKGSFIYFEKRTTNNFVTSKNHSSFLLILQDNNYLIKS